MVFKKGVNKLKAFQDEKLLLVSKELNHFGVIAGLFRQIGGHSSRFVLTSDAIKIEPNTVMFY